MSVRCPWELHAYQPLDRPEWRLWGELLPSAMQSQHKIARLVSANMAFKLVDGNQPGFGSA